MPPRTPRTPYRTPAPIPQAYERSAIECHLLRSSTDPLTRAPLGNASLTPVFVLRSRAQDYRAATARACVERACSAADAADAVRFLRRACELVGDAGPGGLEVQGLSREAVDYALTHPSNAYDRSASTAAGGRGLVGGRACQARGRVG